MEPTREKAPAQLAEIGRRTEERILELLERERRRWTEVAPELAVPLTELAALVRAGGKRLRPAFCHWGAVAAGGRGESDAVVAAGAGIELLHTMALVHDDVMDGSALRRGRRSVHRSFAARHRAESWAGEARRFGEGAAVLVGDFAFVYADQLFADVPVPARELYDELRLELCVGQFLDLVGTATADRTATGSARIARFKSGKYTVERPLQIGAGVAGGDAELAEALSRIGIPLGHAFQMRDDILGIWGDPEVTGKPAGDDLREGKPTPILAFAWSHADERARAVLAPLGRSPRTDADVDRVRSVLVDLGARSWAETAIERWVDEAERALDAPSVAGEAKVGLKELIHYVAWRER